MAKSLLKHHLWTIHLIPVIEEEAHYPFVAAEAQRTHGASAEIVGIADIEQGTDVKTSHGRKGLMVAVTATHPQAIAESQLEVIVAHERHPTHLFEQQGRNQCHLTTQMQFVTCHEEKLLVAAHALGMVRKRKWVAQQLLGRDTRKKTSTVEPNT